MKKFISSIADKCLAIWYIITSRNFIVATYNKIDIQRQKINCGFVEHLSDDKTISDKFRYGIIEFIEPKNNNF